MGFKQNAIIALLAVSMLMLAVAAYADLTAEPKPQTPATGYCDTAAMDKLMEGLQKSFPNGIPSVSDFTEDRMARPALHLQENEKIIRYPGNSEIDTHRTIWEPNGKSPQVRSMERIYTAAENYGANVKAAGLLIQNIRTLCSGNLAGMQEDIKRLEQAARIYDEMIPSNLLSHEYRDHLPITAENVHTGNDGNPVPFEIAHGAKLAGNGRLQIKNSVQTSTLTYIAGNKGLTPTGNKTIEKDGRTYDTYSFYVYFYEYTPKNKGKPAPGSNLGDQLVQNYLGAKELLSTGEKMVKFVEVEAVEIEIGSEKYFRYKIIREEPEYLSLPEGFARVGVDADFYFELADFDGLGNRLVDYEKKRAEAQRRGLPFGENFPTELWNKMGNTKSSDYSLV
ncbi:MAG: hypothetical protein Q8Q97_00280, partial [bacterium]|nr:hypothetical protein [bacterium]